MNEVTLYMKKDCPLCEEVKVVLEWIKDDYEMEYREIDIESDERIHEKYMLEIPVVLVNGEELMLPQLNEVTIRERLQK